METWVVVALVVLAVALVGAGVYWYIRQRTPAVAEDAGATITPQFISPGDGAGGQYYPTGYWPVGYWPKYGTNTPAPPATTTFSHVYLYRRRRK